VPVDLLSREIPEVLRLSMGGGTATAAAAVAAIVAVAEVNHTVVDSGPNAYQSQDEGQTGIEVEGDKDAYTEMQTDNATAFACASVSDNAKLLPSAASEGVNQGSSSGSSSYSTDKRQGLKEDTLPSSSVALSGTGMDDSAEESGSDSHDDVCVDDGLEHLMKNFKTPLPIITTTSAAVGESGSDSGSNNNKSKSDNDRNNDYNNAIDRKSDGNSDNDSNATSTSSLGAQSHNWDPAAPVDHLLRSTALDSSARAHMQAHIQEPKRMRLMTVQGSCPAALASTVGLCNWGHTHKRHILAASHLFGAKAVRRIVENSRSSSSSDRNRDDFSLWGLLHLLNFWEESYYCCWLDLRYNI
jgi:hypothetical protein